MTVLEYMWANPHFRDAFAEHAKRQGLQPPTFHEMFHQLTSTLSREGYAWLNVGGGSDGSVTFDWVRHTPEDWARVIKSMSQDIADRISKRILSNID